MNWKLQREKQYRASEKPLDRELPQQRAEPHLRFVQEELPYFQKQDDYDAFLRHKQAMVKRAFAWYRLGKKKDKSRLIDVYNRTALMGKQR